MGIFGWSGAAGLPPLGDDDNDKQSQQRGNQGGRHVCPDCGAAAEAGLAYCWECSLRRVRNQQVFAAPVGLPSASDLEKQRRASAPLFTLGAPLDERCHWCCAIKNEHIASPVGDDRVYSVQPTMPDSQDAWGRVIPGYECKLHLARRLAYEDVCAAMVWMRDEGMSSAEIAEYFRWGYLGDYR